MNGFVCGFPIPYTVALIIVQIKAYTVFGRNILTTFSGFVSQDRLLTLAVLHKSSLSDRYSWSLSLLSQELRGAY